MKLWPFSKRAPEVRQAQPFTDAIVSAIQAQATGGALAQPNATAAVETAAGFYARALAAAVVRGAGMAKDALTPPMLSLAARDLIRRGESIFLVEIESGRLMLRPAGSWDVRGGPRESEWWYRLDLFGPSGNETRFVPAASVIHFRYAVDAARPWAGISPIDWARLTAAGLANLESMVTSEAASPFGYILPIPSEGDDDDGDDTAALRGDMFSARGKTLLVGDASQGEESAGRSGAAYRTIARFGANPPASVEGLRRDTSDGRARGVRAVGGAVQSIIRRDRAARGLSSSASHRRPSCRAAHDCGASSQARRAGLGARPERASRSRRGRQSAKF